MSTTVSQSMLPRLAFSSPHTQAEEIQNTSLVVLESDLSHDFSQAVHSKNNTKNGKLLITEESRVC